MTTNPAVPEGTRVYLESVSYVGEARVPIGRALAPFLETEIRKLVDSAGCVTIVPTSERSTADYNLAIRITDVRHELDIHIYLPSDTYSYTSVLFVTGESRLTPTRVSGKTIVREFPAVDPNDAMWIWGSGSTGSRNPDPYPASLKLGGGELLEEHSGAVATSVLSDLVFVTNESLLKLYERKRSRYEEGLGIIDPRG